MGIECGTGTVIPTNNDKILCGKGLINAKCVLLEDEQEYLDLEPESSIEEAIIKIAQLLSNTRARLNAIDGQGI